MKLKLLVLLASCCLTGCVGLFVQHPISTRKEEYGQEAVQRTRGRIQREKCARVDESK